MLFHAGTSWRSGHPLNITHCRESFHLEGEVWWIRTYFWLFLMPSAGVTKEGRTSKDHFWPHEHQSSVDSSHGKVAKFPAMPLGKQSPVTQSQKGYLLSAHEKQSEGNRTVTSWNSQPLSLQPNRSFSEVDLYIQMLFRAKLINILEMDLIPLWLFKTWWSHCCPW